MKIAFLTLGCKVNFYETEKMMEQFRLKGFEVVEFAEKADIYVINTCTVTNIADRKSRQMIHRAKKKNPGSIVVAVGCYVESGGDKLKEDAAIDAAFSNKEKENIADKIIERFDLKRILEAPEKLSEQKEQCDFPHERTRAYIKIQDGCNQFCTYCMIPYVRGRGTLMSMPVKDVITHVRRLADRGFKEVVLTGIHLSSYGVDFSRETNFVKLKGKPLLDVIRRTAEVEGIERIRLSSLEPRIITEDFLKELVKIPKVCPHFHLSLQSGCDTVLQRMNRHYTTVEYGKIMEMIRKYFDNPALTTDVIVGFPRETDVEFEKTRNYLKQICLSDIHVFQYSPRSGTRAAIMEGQVRPEVKHARSEILLADTKQYQEKYYSGFMGKEERVLFEEMIKRNGKDYLVGHNERYVRIGVPAEEAERMHYDVNEIHTVTVRHMFPK